MTKLGKGSVTIVYPNGHKRELGFATPVDPEDQKVIDEINAAPAGTFYIEEIKLDLFEMMMYGKKR